MRGEDPRTRGAAERARWPDASAMERPTGLLDALCEGSFVRSSDGRLLFFPWGAVGRGYAVPSEERYRRLRRQTKRLLAIGLFGTPVLAAVGVGPFGVRPVMATGLLLALLLPLRLGWLTRGLERIPERITRAEHNARVARSLRRLFGRADGGEEGPGPRAGGPS